MKAARMPQVEVRDASRRDRSPHRATTSRYPCMLLSESVVERTGECLDGPSLTAAILRSLRDHYGR